MTADAPPPGYRPCVGLMVFNQDGRIFAGLRSDMAGDAWQMPQGGIDAGETPRDAALRELVEEIGTDKCELVAESPGWLTYDLPEALRGKIWGGRYLGQAQRWFLLRFTGSDSDIDLASHAPSEFKSWRWMTLDEAVDGIVAFKQPIYRRVARRFSPLIRQALKTQPGVG